MASPTIARYALRVFGMDVMFLQEGAFSSDTAVVLTTHERFAYFSAVFSEEVDARFNPKKDPPLDDLLHNVIVAGGKTVIIDEDYFMNHLDLVHGLERFVDNEVERERLDIFVVCSTRHAGDRLLAFLVMYCGIYNIVFGKQGSEITLSLGSLLKKKRARHEVRELVEPFCWSRFWRKGGASERMHLESPGTKPVQTQIIEQVGDRQKQNSQEVVFDVRDMKKIAIQFKIRTIFRD